MMWIVVYQLNTGSVYGWVCQATSAAEAEQQFGKSTIVPPGSTVRCVAQLPAGTIEPYFSLYQEAQ